MAFDDHAVAASASGERDGVGGDGGDNTGEGGDAFAGLIQQLHGSLRRVAVDAWVDGHHEDVVRAEADIDSGGALQATQEETGGAEEYERGGDLNDKKYVAEAPAATRSGERILALQGVGEHGTGGDP